MAAGAEPSAKGKLSSFPFICAHLLLVSSRQVRLSLLLSQLIGGRVSHSWAGKDTTNCIGTAQSAPRLFRPRIPAQLPRNISQGYLQHSGVRHQITLMILTVTADNQPLSLTYPLLQRVSKQTQQGHSQLPTNHSSASAPNAVLQIYPYCPRAAGELKRYQECLLKCL